MTNDDGMARGGGEHLGTAEVRRVLTGQLGYALPADLVITTGSEIETREFTAYGQGWRDCVEHAEQHTKAAHAHAAGDQKGKILPFPHQRQSSPTSTGDPDRHSPGHSAPPSDEPS